jgi:hypothetical protein
MMCYIKKTTRKKTTRNPQKTTRNPQKNYPPPATRIFYQTVAGKVLARPKITA